jgi:hypothetical protein
MNRLKVSTGASSLNFLAADPIEKENRIKSGVTTTVIAICVALILWLYRINLEVPVPLPEAHEVEVAIEPAQGGGGGGGSPSDAPVDPAPQVNETPRSVEETQDPDATVEQVKTPDKPVVPPEPEVDPSIARMRANRQKAQQEAEANKNKGTGKGTGEGSGEGSGKGPGKGSGDGGGIGSGHGPGVGHTFGGRSFRPGNTPTDCHEAGKVILEVMLLPNGKIIFQDVDPGTTGSDCLIRAAKEILKNSSFNEAANKPAGVGTITFNFRLN